MFTFKFGGFVSNMSYALMQKEIFVKKKKTSPPTLFMDWQSCY